MSYLHPACTASKSAMPPFFSLLLLTLSPQRTLCFPQLLFTIDTFHNCSGVNAHAHGKLIPLDIDHCVSLLVYCVRSVCVCGVRLCMCVLCVWREVVIRLVARGNRNGCFQKWL